MIKIKRKKLRGRPERLIRLKVSTNDERITNIKVENCRNNLDVSEKYIVEIDNMNKPCHRVLWIK